ncbi:MoeA, N-terminal and linker domain-containing protein [Crassisporium funariophilum]|nr:MoeA, N-terminal and linker domain-containing protein [Crassisporium funariophilum]
MAPTSLNDAQAIVCAAAAADRKSYQSRTESVLLADAIGRLSASDVLCESALPTFDNSAMDGYALSSSESASASSEHPVRFTVIGTIYAGDPPPPPLPSSDGDSNTRTCYAIMTGAPFPLDSYYDACVRLEETTRPDSDTSTIQIHAPVRPFANRRWRGEDYQPHDTALVNGDRVKLGHILLLASLGMSSIFVCSKIRIGVASTGDELLAPTSEMRAGGIRDSNGPYTTACLKTWGFDAFHLPPIPDASAAFNTFLSSSRGCYDLLITTGAVSKGQHDFIPTTLRQEGHEIVFHGVQMRPGHPVLFARLHPGMEYEIPLFALPGNPRAAAVCLRFLVYPYLRALEGMGREKPGRARLMNRIGRNECGKCVIWPAIVEGGEVRVLTENNGAGMIKDVVCGNAWVVDTGEGLTEGETVEIWHMSPIT